MRTLVSVFIGLFIVTLFACDSNDSPVIGKVEVNRTEVEPGGEVAINVIANGEDGDKLTYEYEISAGEVVGSVSIVIWKAPQSEGTQFIEVTVSDGDKWDQASVTMEVTKGKSDDKSKLPHTLAGRDHHGIPLVCYEIPKATSDAGRRRMS